MRMEHLFPQEQSGMGRLSLRAVEKADHPLATFARQAPVGILLIIALLAFEIFNFDTTRFALINLLGDIGFSGLRWATILALAFCAIDFAGLAHLFSPGRSGVISGETWYLMGAWILGATMNAVMTWWAVGLALMNHELGNELLSREQLLDIVPPLVAILVWVTRILFIGAFSIAGTHFFENVDIGEEDTVDLAYPDAEFVDHAARLENVGRPVYDPVQPAPVYDRNNYRSVARGPRPSAAAFEARSRRRR